MPAAAQTQTDSASGPFITAEQARDAFMNAGYKADPIIDRAGRTPSLQTLLRTFDVHDPANRRMVMVLVFPSVEAAGLFRTTLAMDGETNRPDPLLVTGYGPSLWRGNVAMVESTESNLARVAQLQAGQDTGIYADPSGGPDPRAPDIQVDLDFQQALNSSDVNM
jgi:hypothetical protein